MIGHRLEGRAWVLLAVSALVAPASGCSWVEDSSSCADLDETVQAVQELFALDWVSLDERAVRSAWPLARDLSSFCEGCAGSGPEGARKVLGCCRACAVCPSIHFEFPGDVRTPLEVISVAMCSTSLGDTERDLAILLESIETEGDVLYESVRGRSRSIAFVREGDGYRRAIHSTLTEHDDLWIANVTLHQCATERPVLELPGRNDQSVRVTDIRIGTSSSGESYLAIEYSTHCYALDRRCVEEEARALWPHIRERADEALVSEVVLHAEGCGVSTSVSYREDDEGGWVGHYAYGR